MTSDFQHQELVAFHGDLAAFDGAGIHVVQQNGLHFAGQDNVLGLGLEVAQHQQVLVGLAVICEEVLLIGEVRNGLAVDHCFLIVRVLAQCQQLLIEVVDGIGIIDLTCQIDLGVVGVDLEPGGTGGETGVGVASQCMGVRALSRE